MEAEVKGSASGLCTGGPPAFAAFVQATKEPTPLGALGAWIPASAGRPSPFGEQPPASPAAPGPEGVPGFPVRGVSGISRLHGEIFLGIYIPAVKSLFQAFSCVQGWEALAEAAGRRGRRGSLVLIPVAP